MNKKQFKSLIKEIVSECINETGEDPFDVYADRRDISAKKAAEFPGKVGRMNRSARSALDALQATLSRADAEYLLNALHQKLHGSKSPYADPWEKESEPEVEPYKGKEEVPPIGPDEPTSLDDLSDEDPLETPEDEEPISPPKKK